MTAYLLYMISPIIVSLILGVTKGQQAIYSKKYLLVMGIIMFLFFSLRSADIGSGDARFYYNLWESASRVSYNQIESLLLLDLEKGYLVSTWVLSHIFKSGQFVFVFAAIVYSIAICRFLYINADDFVLGFLLFNSLGLAAFFLQGLRQSIAICICLMALKPCKDRKFIRFLILIAVAISFHSSAALFIIVYYIYGMKINWKTTLLSLLVIPFGTYILNAVRNIANFLINS